MAPSGVDEAFAACVTALAAPEYRHLLGVGVLVYGKCWLGGPDTERRTNVFSVTKAVLARAISEAVHDGVFRSVDDIVSVVGADQVRPTVRDLLWMTQSWLVNPDMDEIERQSTDPLAEITAALDSVPVRKGRYVNAGMHLLMRELQHRTGDARTFVDERVLRPAGIVGYEWDVDPTGVPWGHAHLQLSVQDVVRLGAHWLDHDRLAWRGEPPTPAMSPEHLPYSAGLWISDKYHLAAGWGGQCLMLVPVADAVLVALTATGWDRETNTDTLPTSWKTGRELLSRTMLPALVS